MPLKKNTKISNVLVGLVAKITFLFWCSTDIFLNKQHEIFELRNRSSLVASYKGFSTGIFFFSFFFFKKSVNTEVFVNPDKPELYSCHWSTAWNVYKVSSGRYFSLRGYVNYICCQFATVTKPGRKKNRFDTDLLFLGVNNTFRHKHRAENTNSFH